MQIDDYGEHWKVIVNPAVLVEQDFPMTSSRAGKPTFLAGIGYDPRPPAGHKMGYMLYPKNVWSREELMNDEQIKKMTMHCNVCSALDVAKRSIETKTEPIAQPLSAPAPPPQAITPPATFSAGNVLTPSYIPLITTVAKRMLCTKLGDVTSSIVMSVIADVVSGWSSDPGQKEAMRQMSEGFAALDLCPADISQLRQDTQVMYEEWKKGGVGNAMRKSMFKSVDEALKDGVGIDVKQIKTKHIRASFNRGGMSNLVD